MTVLNWNVCALDHQLSLLFGGVVPWQDRIEKIAKQIVKLAPDVICLQEMFAPEASQVLVRKLRSSYAHFYVQMGPHPAGFSLETLGIPSGLFVASKYPLSHPCFVPYGAGRSPAYRSYGVFSAELSSEGRKIGKLITTHLQPGSTEADQNYRSLQMKLIHEMTHQASCPVFLCGDFNIERKSQEFTRLLSAYEPSSYLWGNWTCCELRNYWGKAQRDLTSFLALPLYKEWLDYFFCLPTSWVQAKVEVVPVNDVHHPEEALSDHQILFATLQFQTLKVD